MKGGYRCGKGTLTFGPNALEKTYRGLFADDEMEGQGELLFKDGSQYRGRFYRGVLEGDA
jgi:hypothetical protein